MPHDPQRAGQGATDNVAFLPGVREADAQRAENVTLHALTRRGLSRGEVVDLLRRREIDPIVAQAEVERLERVGLIDDAALAATLVERLVERKKLGPAALRAELGRRRLDPATIEAALADGALDDEGALVAELVADRARRLGEVDRDTAERRLLSYLARKGHGGSIARDAVRSALDELGLERAPRQAFGAGRGGIAAGRADSGLSRRGAGSTPRLGGRLPGDGPARVAFE
ncbi:regulatory protein RecX [Microcella alkalica]|uniref:regulatory protein RecX n=1 Tax=Microcella alkalica TaxID=355930 RepID=UPI00145FC4FB|nr:regulatory protein RecX [Microcella alkalica]